MIGYEFKPPLQLAVIQYDEDASIEYGVNLATRKWDGIAERKDYELPPCLPFEVDKGFIANVGEEVLIFDHNLYFTGEVSTY